MEDQEIMASAREISLAPATGTGKPKFCEVWPTAKQGLELLRDLVKNPVVKAIIGTVIKTGDAVSSVVCGGGVVEAEEY